MKCVRELRVGYKWMGEMSLVGRRSSIWTMECGRWYCSVDWDKINLVRIWESGHFQCNYDSRWQISWWIIGTGKWEWEIENELRYAYFKFRYKSTCTECFAVRYCIIVHLHLASSEIAVIIKGSIVGILCNDNDVILNVLNWQLKKISFFKYLGVFGIL